MNRPECSVHRSSPTGTPCILPVAARVVDRHCHGRACTTENRNNACTIWHHDIQLETPRRLLFELADLLAPAYGVSSSPRAKSFSTAHEKWTRRAGKLLA
ncbi:hypothetical protein CBOM_05680 [Ceraceosorus bombacis]|uniref:Uncharacterized protein n=1 Tax=Ceraceosorus bombacis TaxID=401625 RepID=A0A0P1BRJ1_9BASI|nr:hypothetical protein CBOM_05680 [Ceraceosorus bombacis]